MNRASRWLLFQLGREVSRDQARDLARRACEERGLPWREPVRVYRHFGDWAIWTDAKNRGGNVHVFIDGGNGAVKNIAGPMPR